MSPQNLPVEDLLASVPASGELADAVADVKRLRWEAEDKATELDQAIERLRTLTDRAERSPAVASAPVPARRPLRPVASPENRAPEEALLRATRMAVSGSARSEIEATLREEYDVPDAGRIVEQILGPERKAVAATDPVEGSPTASS